MSSAGLVVGRLSCGHRLCCLLTNVCVMRVISAPRSSKSGKILGEAARAGFCGWLGVACVLLAGSALGCAVLAAALASAAGCAGVAAGGAAFGWPHWLLG